MKLSFSPHTLYFKQPFKIAHGTRTSTPIVLTELEHEGIVGYGEASMPPYLGETHESVCLFLSKASVILSTFNNPLDIENILSEIDAISEKNTAAKAAIDIALYDLVGKIKNQPCWKIFGYDKSKTPYTTYTIGIDNKEGIVQKVKDGGEYKILKVKLDGVNDKEIITTIRSLTNKPIAVDVNQGWKNKHHALEMIKWLTEKNILFVEQPLPKDNFEDASWLFEKSELPLFADESIQRLTDMDKTKNCFHGINIKLMKCTGIHEAQKMIAKAKTLNLKLLIGCMSETSCAISAAAQLSPLFDYADLDGPLLIKNDLFMGVKFIGGKITLNELPGIGALPV